MSAYREIRNAPLVANSHVGLVNRRAYGHLSHQFRSREPYGSVLPPEKHLAWEQERILKAMCRVIELLVEKGIIKESEATELLDAANSGDQAGPIVSV
jgi:hypothetical protein